MESTASVAKTCASPPILVVSVGEGEVRRDYESDDVRRVYPDLPKDSSRRNAFVERCDNDAYLKIKDIFPGFRPRRYASSDVENRSA